MCISAFFLKISFSLSFFLCLVSCSAISICFVRLCLPPISLPACFPGQAKPSSSLPSPLSCAVYALSLLCSPVKWVSHGPTACSLRTTGRGAEQTDTKYTVTRTQSKGSKVTSSRPWDRNCLKVASHSVKTSPLLFVSRLGFLVLNWVQSLRAICILMSDWLADLLECWWDEVAGSLTGWLTCLSIWHSSWVFKWFADWHVLRLTGGVKIKATLNYCNFVSLLSNATDMDHIRLNAHQHLFSNKLHPCWLDLTFSFCSLMQFAWVLAHFIWFSSLFP